MRNKRILAIETSCDDTGIAILEWDNKGQPSLLADLVSSQVKIHAPWGGVVPMLAKREHQKNLLPLLKKALVEAGLVQAQNSKIKTETLNSILEREPELLKNLLPFFKKYQKPDIDYIAVTAGPGLEPALWVGVNLARALSYFWQIPIIPVNHVEAHISANWILSSVIPAKAGIQKIWMPDQVRHDKKGLFPAVCLVVSGGHTQLILIKKLGRYQVIGETRDDAAGEAFDKVAKMLGLGYPGGPLIADLAKKVSHSEAQSAEESPTNVGNEVSHSREILRSAQNDTIKLPRPMLNSNDFDFSFSGLKTAVLYLIKKLTQAQIKKLTPAIAAEFQQAAVDVLVAKTVAAAKKYRAKTILLSGGVAANDLLRETLSLAADHLSLNFSAPLKNYCTDNAAMIALTAFLKKKKTTRWQDLKALSNLRIDA